MSVGPRVADAKLRSYVVGRRAIPLFTVGWRIRSKFSGTYCWRLVRITAELFGEPVIFGRSFRRATSHSRCKIQMALVTVHGDIAPAADAEATMQNNGRVSTTPTPRAVPAILFSSGGPAGPTSLRTRPAAEPPPAPRAASSLVPPTASTLQLQLQSTFRCSGLRCHRPTSPPDVRGC